MDSWIRELGDFQLVNSWIRELPAAANPRIHEFVNSGIRLVNSGIRAPVNLRPAEDHLWLADGRDLAHGHIAAHGGRPEEDIRMLDGLAAPCGCMPTH